MEDIPKGTGGTVAALLSGHTWPVTGAITVITYSFAGPASVYGAGAAAFDSSRSHFSAFDQALTRQVLDAVSATCKLRFVEVADSGASAGMLRYAYSAYPNLLGDAGYAFFPSDDALGGDVWLGQAQAGSEWQDYRGYLLLHETLHALGLKHPFEGEDQLTGAANTIPNTVMSYSVVQGSAAGALAKFPMEPMKADIQALQALYGAAASHSGDTRYDLSDAAFDAFRAIWDAGGIDTLDASDCARGVRLDLQPGARSDIGVEIMAFDYRDPSNGRAFVQSTWTDTLALADGSWIEHATGSAFDDVLLGNALDNRLDGGDGDDVLEGRGGSDTLLGGAGDDVFRVAGGRPWIDGGSGNDTVVFSGRIADYAIVQSAAASTVTRLDEPSSIATLTRVERVQFADTALEAHSSDAPRFTPDGAAGQALRLYKAALGRMPDSAGLQHHTQALLSGAALAEVAQHFIDSPEFSARYAAPQDSAFVQLLYRNVLDREPDAAGLAWYLTQLDHHATSRAALLAGFSESPEHQAALIGIGQALLYPA